MNYRQIRCARTGSRLPYLATLSQDVLLEKVDGCIVCKCG